jgi:hypothetical protein
LAGRNSYYVLAGVLAVGKYKKSLCANRDVISITSRYVKNVNLAGNHANSAMMPCLLSFAQSYKNVCYLKKNGNMSDGHTDKRILCQSSCLLSVAREGLPRYIALITDVPRGLKGWAMRKANYTMQDKAAKICLGNLGPWLETYFHPVQLKKVFFDAVYSPFCAFGCHFCFWSDHVIYVIISSN